MLMVDKQGTTKGAIQHLEEALAAAENDETKFHLRQALHLLGIEK